MYTAAAIGFTAPSCVRLAECNAAIHKKCIDKVIANCTGSAIDSKETMVTHAKRGRFCHLALALTVSPP